jgi:hypothetical protein
MLLLPVALLTACTSVLFVDEPEVAMTLRIPNTKLELGLGYRQVEAANLAPFQEPDGASEEDLQRLRVKAIFAVGGKITSDVGLRCGEQSFPAGEYDFGFTTGAGGEVHFFIAVGQRAFALESEAVTSGVNTGRLTMQFLFVSRTEAELLWQLGDKAGRIKLAMTKSGKKGAGEGEEEAASDEEAKPAPKADKPAAPAGDKPAKPADKPKPKAGGKAPPADQPNSKAKADKPQQQS